MTSEIKKGGFLFVKKLSICFLALFASLLLAVPVALAADGVQELNVKNPETTKITPMQSDKATPATQTNGVYQNVSVFNITSQAEDGKLYLIVIRSGAENQLPTESNLFYMDLLEAQEGSVVSDAYPKDLEAGSYHIELTDYSDNGKLKEIASFTVSAGSASRPGDLDGDNSLTIDDITKLIKFVANKATAAEAGQSADVNGDGELTIDDITRLIKMVANKE